MLVNGGEAAAILIDILVSFFALFGLALCITRAVQNNINSHPLMVRKWLRGALFFAGILITVNVVVFMLA
jgi:hypothetical protein